MNRAASGVVKHFRDAGLGGRFSSIVEDTEPLDVAIGEIAGTLTGQQLTNR